MTIKGLIFDCDGTLADTMPLHWQAWRKVTTRHGVRFPETRFYALGGVPSRDIFQMLREEQNLNLDPLTLAREREEKYLKSMARVAPDKAVVSSRANTPAGCRRPSLPAARSPSSNKH